MRLLKKKERKKSLLDASYKGISGMTHWDKTLRLTRNELQEIYIPSRLEKASLTPKEELEDKVAGRDGGSPRRNVQLNNPS